jgi:signal transduction histidine kinase
MKNRIIWLLFVCIVLILLLQILWLKNTYEINRSAYDLTLKQVLQKTLDDYYQIASNKMVVQLKGMAVKSNPKWKVKASKYYTSVSLDPSSTDTFNLSGNKENITSGLIDISISDARKDISECLKLNLMNSGFNSNYEFILKEVTNNSLISAPQSILFNPPSFKPVKWELQLITTDQSTVLIKKTIPIFILTILLLLIVVFFYTNTLKNLSIEKKMLLEKNSFMSNMTHELKTPLSAIQLVIDNVRYSKDYSEESINSHFLTIETQKNKLNNLVQKALDMVKFDNKELMLNMEVLNAEVPLKATLENLQSLINNWQIKIDYKAQSADLPILGDRFYLETVFTNIIENAIKYGKENLKLAIRINYDSKYISIRISDNGKGIMKADLEKVFERFYRSEKSNQHNIKGHGLGLAFCKEIVELHGGSIKLNSEIGVGTEVYVNLPRLDEKDIIS